jgi:hypothetical protein
LFTVNDTQLAERGRKQGEIHRILTLSGNVFEEEHRKCISMCSDEKTLDLFEKNRFP